MKAPEGQATDTKGKSTMIADGNFLQRGTEPRVLQSTSEGKGDARGKADGRREKGFGLDDEVSERAHRGWREVSDVQECTHSDADGIQNLALQRMLEEEPSPTLCMLEAELGA